MEGENFTLMESAPVGRAVLKLAIPTVFSTIITLIYNLTDTFFIGMLDDPLQLAAISLTFPVFIIIQAIGNIFASGAPSYISRCLGAKKYDESKHTSAVSLYSALIGIFVVTVCCFIFMTPILNAIGTSSDTIEPTRQYMSVICGFSFVLTLQIILPAMLRAEGKVRQAVTGMVIGTVLNIILDPIFILGFDWGIAGAAWATIIGNLGAVVYYIIYFLREKGIISIFPKDFKPSVTIYREVLKIGLPSSLAQIIMSFANILTNNLAVVYGDEVISAFGVAGKALMMIVMIVTGFVMGFTPFAGYNYGARNTHRLIAAIKFTLLAGTAGCIVFLFLFLGLGPLFMSAFTSNERVIQVGVRLIQAQAWCVPTLAMQMTMMATFQATGQAAKAAIVNFGRQCLFLIPLLFILNAVWGLTGLMYAQSVADILTTLVALLVGIPFLKELHKQDRSLSQA